MSIYHLRTAFTPSPLSAHISAPTKDTFSAHHEADLAARMAKTARKEREAAIKRDGKMNAPASSRRGGHDREATDAAIIAAIIGEMSMPQICAASGIPESTTYNALTRLVGDGLVIRTITKAGGARRAWYEVAK